MTALGNVNKRQRGKTTTSNMLALDVRYLHREGLLTLGRCSNIDWCLNGKNVGTISIRAEENCILLDYSARQPCGEWEEQKYPVSLVWTPCHFGGQRAWFLCPCCDRRVAILYGGPIFACRYCHNLTYDSTDGKLYLREHRQALKIRDRLGWRGESRSKPKGMHWRTFERLAQEYDRLDMESWIAIAKKIRKKR